jgi:hypothetical protein
VEAVEALCEARCDKNPAFLAVGQPLTRSAAMPIAAEMSIGFIGQIACDFIKVFAVRESNIVLTIFVQNV